MPKKAKGGGARRKGGGDDTASADVDYLSESHTIATLNSNANSIEDDPSWGLEDDHIGNTTTEEQNLQAAEVRHAKLVEALASVDDYPTEKRAAKREQWLKLWFKALTQYASVGDPALLDKQEDLLQCCRQGLRAGTPSEQYAACRVLEAGALVMGTDDDSYHSQIQGHLTRLVVSAHRATLVRVAALRALGMAVFVGVDDDAVTEELLDLCESLAQTEYRGDAVPSALRAAALEVWTVLATTIHELYLAGKDDSMTGRGLLLLPLLLESLEQTQDASLRTAAGECVAWIHTCRLALGIMESEAQEEPLNTTQKQYQQGSWEGSEWEDCISEITAVMDQLSNQSGHSMSKKAKKELRANFREYLATLQENEPPNEVIQFRGGSLELNSWKEILALQFVRRCLQGGFQMQLLTNATLQAIFGANGQALNNAAGLSQLEKRLYMSKTSEAAKLKDMDRTKKRDKRTNIKNHFLTADGEDL